MSATSGVTISRVEQALTETNAALSIPNTDLVIVNSQNVPITSGIASLEITGIAKSGATTGLSASDAQLTAFLRPSLTTGTPQYSFTSGATTFDYLAEGQSINLTYTVLAKDASGVVIGTKQLILAVAGTNDAPVVSQAVTGTATEDAAVGTKLRALQFASDVDAGTTLAVVPPSGALPAGVTYNTTTREFTLDPSHAAYQSLKAGATTTVTVNYGVFDGIATTPAIARWTVTGTNDAPIVSASATRSLTDTAADDSYPELTGNLSVTEIDSGDTASFAITGQAALTSANAMAGFTHQKVGNYGTLFINNSTGAYKYVPNDSKIEGLKTNATDAFTFNVTDGSGVTVSQALSIAITGANDTPTLTASVTSAAFADTAADNTFADVVGTLTSTDRDLGDSKTFSITEGVTSTATGFTHQKVGNYGTLYINNSTGAYKYVPNDSAIEGLKSNASESFTLNVTDGSGVTVSQAFNVAITGTNDIPTLTAELIDQVAIPTKTFTYQIPSDAFVDRDLADANLTLSVARADGSALPTWLTFNPTTKTFTGTPSQADLAGVAGISVRVTASDGQASVNDIFVIGYRNTNNAPSAVSTSASATEDTTYALRVSDFGYSDPDDDPLGAITITSLPGNGSLLFRGTAVLPGEVSAGFKVALADIPSLTFAPNPNYNGTASFTFTAEDQFGAVSPSSTFTLAVAAVNDLPTLTGTP
ncbi:MAG: hypothetical protein EBX99_12065, partial [Acidimicrobiia bacterium]|nr:hypothetical protein [Acidimicrobiia bacterium]